MKSKRLLTTLVMACICTSALAANVSAQEIENVDVIVPEAIVSSASVEVQPRADIIGWRYKIENGRQYRRQYNYTQDCWVGEWELVPLS